MEKRISFIISLLFHLLIFVLLVSVHLPQKKKAPSFIHKKLKGIYAYVPPKGVLPPMPYVARRPPGPPSPPPSPPPARKRASGKKGGGKEKVEQKGLETEKKKESKGELIARKKEKGNEGSAGEGGGSGLRVSPSLPETRGVGGGGGSRFWNALSHLSRYLPQGMNFSSGSTAGKVVGGSAIFESGDYDISPWAEKVIAKVKGNWIVPLAAKLGFKGVSVIYLVIERDGRVSFLAVERPSGIKVFDQAALNAIKSSSPFPPLPPDFPLPNLKAHFFFFYNVSPPSR